MCKTCESLYKDDEDYFIEGYQILFNYRPLSRLMEYDIFPTSRVSLTFLLVRVVRMQLLVHFSTRFLWSFSIICVAMPFLVFLLVTVRLCSFNFV